LQPTGAKGKFAPDKSGEFLWQQKHKLAITFDDMNGVNFTNL
jgi:hypothetical protein